MSTVTIGAFNPRVLYYGAWQEQGNGGWAFTGNVGAGFKFSFNGLSSLPFPHLVAEASLEGTAIYYYATKVDRSAALSAQIDGSDAGIIDGSIGATADGEKTIIWARTGLSPTRTHTLQAQLIGPGSQGGPYAELVNLL